VLAAVQTAMMAELPYTKLRDAVVSHLTMAEGLGPLFETIPSRRRHERERRVSKRTKPERDRRANSCRPQRGLRP
jgi:hypothetical protein